MVELTFELGKSRFHKEAWQMVSFLAILQEAQNPGVSFSNRLQATSIPFDLQVNLDGVYALFSTSRVQKQISWQVVPHARPAHVQARYFDIGPNELRFTFFLSLLSQAFETYNDWLVKTFGDRSLWPPVSNFVRVTRNAAFHGGAINISSQDAPSVSWRSIDLGYATRNHLIGEYISPCEVITLLYDFQQELDQLDAPRDFHWQRLEYQSRPADILQPSLPQPHQRRPGRKRD